MSTKSYDSSPESIAGSDDLCYNRFYDFRIVGDKLRCTDPAGDRLKIVKLSSLNWFANLDPNREFEGNPTNSIVTASCSDIYATLEEWTIFFMTEKKIKMNGKHKCGNNLSTRAKKDVVEVEADILFPYYSTETLHVNGEVTGGASNCPFPQVHLDPDCPKITLKKKTVYLIGTGPDECRLRRMPFCRICSGKHYLSETPCPRAQHFVATDGSRELRSKVGFACSGASVICVRPNGETFFNTSMMENWLCSSCEEKAVSAKTVWFEMDGNCELETCMNEDVFCMREVEGCKHYIYVRQGVEHNLSSYVIPRALEEGRLKPVMAASVHKQSIVSYARLAREVALKAFKNGDKISLQQLVWRVGCSQLELLTIAMYDTRFADCIADNKRFTLNKINGFIEKPNVTKVGPWLDGRLVEDRHGMMWHVPKSERITINTKDSVSYINKWRASDGESDALGQFVA